MLRDFTVMLILMSSYNKALIIYIKQAKRRRNITVPS